MKIGSVYDDVCLLENRLFLVVVFSPSVMPYIGILCCH